MTKLYLADFARRAGIDTATLRAYRTRGTPRGNPVPEPDDTDIVAGHARPWWRQATVDEWIAARTGPGFRSDLEPKHGRKGKTHHARRQRPYPEDGRRCRRQGRHQQAREQTMKANRGDIHGMTLIARQEAAALGSPIYLVPTGAGYARETEQPDGWTKHLRVDPDGQVWLVPQTKCPIPGSVAEPQLLVAATA